MKTTMNPSHRPEPPQSLSQRPTRAGKALREPFRPSCKQRRSRYSPMRTRAKTRWQ